MGHENHKTELRAYREHLIKAEQESLRDYDKTLLSLSGGALGISFAFIRDIVGDGPIEHPRLLLAAWIAWGLAATATLFSFYLSHHALRTAIRQVDAETIHKRTPGGCASCVISVLNVTTGVLFLVGVILIVLFVSYNLR